MNNSPEQIALRRAQNTLIIVGTGIVMFSVWTALKSIGLVLFNRGKILLQLREMMGDSSHSLTDGIILTALIIGVVIYVGLSTGLRAFIGASAIGVGKNKRRHAVYIPLTIILIFNSVFSILDMLDALIRGIPSDSLMGNASLAAVIIELTSMIMMIQMVSAAVKVRKIKRQAA